MRSFARGAHYDYRQVRSRPRSAQGNFKHGLRNVDAHDRARDAHSRSEGQRGLAAAATNVNYMLALSRLQYCVEKLMSKIVGLRVKLSEGYRGKTQWLDLSIQWLLKLCPCFAGARIPIFDLCGVRRSRRDLRHDSAGLSRLRQFIGR